MYILYSVYLFQFMGLLLNAGNTSPTTTDRAVLPYRHAGVALLISALKRLPAAALVCKKGVADISRRRLYLAPCSNNVLGP